MAKLAKFSLGENFRLYGVLCKDIGHTTCAAGVGGSLTSYRIHTVHTSFTQTKAFPGHFGQDRCPIVWLIQLVCLLQCWGQPSPVGAQATCLYQQVH